VLLLTDVASRTPVLVDRTDARAILLGDGGGNPRLGFMRGVDPVREGDRILTSGDGGVFPRGLPVGVAAKGLDGQWRVRLYADLTAIDFIRVLEFEDFTAGINEKALEGGAMPPVPASLLARDAAQAEAAKLVIPQAKDAAGKPGAAAAKPGATAKPADGDAKATALKAKDSAGKAAPPKDPQARDAEPKGAPSRGARPGDAKAAAPAKAADAARSGGLAEELKARIKALTGGADKPAAEPRPKTEARAKTDARAEARPKAEARPVKEAAAP
jgi:rod shape-determining protein MreC